ncbi:AAA family ATPase [Streptomyces sp. XH2]|uniref:AAA family ATPase n=1 Tax=Streptomyces sp. XH2 TaxID=3412483 RepID=UPI003C7B35E1
MTTHLTPYTPRRQRGLPTLDADRAAPRQTATDATAQAPPSARPFPFDPGTLVVLVGIPGCGKSRFAARYPASWRVSLDEYRLAATDDMTDQSATPVAAQIQTLLLDARLARRLTTLVDATNIYPHVRAGLLARARYWQRPTTAILFDIPLETAQAQNANRARVVPTSVLRDLHPQLPTAGQLRSEGFDAVHRVGDLAAVDGRTR